MKSVNSGSVAGRSDIRAGDRIVKVNGQAIISIADIQWVLHNLPNQRTLVRFEVERKGTVKTCTVVPSPGWKKTDISWRGSLWNMRPRLRVWTPEATANDLKRIGLSNDQKALKVKWINRKSPEGGAAFKAGLREGDFIIAIEDKPLRISTRAFNAYVRLNYKPGQKLPVTLWRNGKKIQFKWPLN